jgi:hypothetical protein
MVVLHLEREHLHLHVGWLLPSCNAIDRWDCFVVNSAETFWDRSDGQGDMQVLLYPVGS